MMSQEFFSFQLADAIQIALPLANVDRIVQISRQQICPLPGVASCWAGIVNYEGSLLWLLDSERFFELTPARSLKARHWTAVVVTFQDSQICRRVALSVRELHGLLPLDLSVAPKSSFFPLLPQFQALFRVSLPQENDLLLVLDPEPFFSFLQSSSKTLMNV
jgi:twitching motility protein PilI